MTQLDAEGRLHYPRKEGGRLRLKNYYDELPGVPVQDVWTDIGPIGGTNPERLGYPTQKPESLLERIVTTSSNEGDVVLDPFCGCGTTIAVAQRLRRQWIGIDITYLAIDLIDKRLRDTYGDGVRATYEIRGIPRDAGGARALFNANPFDFERWAVSLVGGQPHQRSEQAGDKGVDGWVRFPVTDREIGRAVVSVKGGRKLTPEMVRELHGTARSQRADMGVLITLEEPTEGLSTRQAPSAPRGWADPPARGTLEGRGTGVPRAGVRLRRGHRAGSFFRPGVILKADVVRRMLTHDEAARAPLRPRDNLSSN